MGRHQWDRAWVEQNWVGLGHNKREKRRAGEYGRHQDWSERKVNGEGRGEGRIEVKGKGWRR